MATLQERLNAAKKDTRGANLGVRQYSGSLQDRLNAAKMDTRTTLTGVSERDAVTALQKGAAVEKPASLLDTMGGRGAAQAAQNTLGLNREKRKSELQSRMKELDEIEAELKAFEMATQYTPAHQRPVKNIGGFTSSRAAREEYDRVMEEYADLLKRFGETDTDFGRNVRYALEKGGAGLGAALEGLGDAAAATLLDGRASVALSGMAPAMDLIQAADQLTGNKVSGAAEQMLKTNPSAERIQDIESRYAPSRAGQIAGEVSQGIGGMLPSIAANVALPGSGMALLGVQAGGQSAQEALNEGATLEQAVNYGALSGGLEAATEAMFGGITGLGKGFLNTAAGKGVGKLIAKLGTSKAGQVLSALAADPLVKALGDSLGEGVEEGVSAVLSPYLERLTYNKQAEAATVEEVLHDVYIGALTGGVFQGIGLAANLAAGQEKTASGMETGKYTQEEAAAIRREGKTFRNLVAGVDSTVSEFFRKWAGGRKSHAGEKLEKLYLGKMSEEVKTEVSEILGYDVTERDFIVTNDDVKHIMDGHGNAKAEIKKGNLPLEQWVLDALPDVVTEPDVIEKGHEGTGKNKGKTGVVLSKVFPGGRVISVQYDNKGRGTLEIVTVYAKESTSSVVNAPEGANTFTSETTEPVLSSEPTVPQAKPEVKMSTFGQAVMDAAAEGRRLQAEREAANRAPEDPRMAAAMDELVRRSANAQKGPQERTGAQAGVVSPERRSEAQGAGEAAQRPAEGRRGEVRDARTAAEGKSAPFAAKDMKYLNAVAEAAGVPINIVDATEDADGWYENGEVYLAENCEDPVNWVATHEITHHLEQAAPEAYSGYLDCVRNILQEEIGEDGLNERVQKIRQHYAERGTELTEEGAMREIAANFTQRLGLDEDLFRRVASENRTVAQRLLDSLKEFIRKVRTRLSGRELSDLERTRQAWGTALRESRGKTVEQAEKKYALRVFEDGRRFVDVQTDQAQFEGLTLDQMDDLAKKIITEKFGGKTVGIDNRTFVNGQSAKEYAHPAKNIYGDIREAKMRASTELDNLIDAGTNFRNEPDGRDGHIHPDVVGGFDYFDTIFKVGDQYYSAVINIKNVAKGKLLKDITQIKNITQDITSSYGQSPKSGFLRDASMDSIRDSAGKSNRENEERQNSLRGTRELEQEQEQGDKLAKGNALRRERTRLSDVEYQKRLLEDGGMAALKENEKRIKSLERQIRSLEGTMEPKTLERKTKAATNTKYLPTAAKKDLRKNLLDLFEIPDGVRGAAGKYIDWVADRMLQTGSLTDKDRRDLLNYLYSTGAVSETATEETLETMEREAEWALRTFAEKARLEISMRKRTGEVLAEERKARRASLERQKERRNMQELQQKTLKQLQWLKKNRRRAPEELKAAFDEVLGDIDTFAVGAANDMNWSRKHQATWRDLAQMYKTAKESDPNFLPSEELERIVKRLDGDKIADLNVDALTDLYKAAVGLRTEFYNRNNVINDEMNRMFAEVYEDSVREISEAKGRYTGKGLDKFMNLNQLTPMNVLERMAGWNRNSAFYSMARQLEKGERDMRAYTVQANAMLEEFLTEHKDWVKKADGQGKDAIWYEIEVPELLELGMGDKPIFGDTRKVYMTPSQKVHLYLESKNYANLRHMVGGRTFVNKELYSKGKRGEAFAQGTTVRLAPETVKKLVSDLTEEEMELARLLERYYDEFAAKKINRVSNALYGFDKVVRKFYAPIFTNKNYVQSEIGVYDMTAEGVGVMKGRVEYSGNPSYNIGCFDAFERHVDQISRYVGMAIPARNWNTLLNWRTKNNSMRDVITHKWGEETKLYIEDVIKGLQGNRKQKKGLISGVADKLMSKHISAVFGVNPSIVLKQLGSAYMAMPELGARNVPSIAQLGAVDRKLIGKYTSELAWRGLGYATPETKKLKENPSKVQSSKAVRFVTGGAITAMDQATAAALWPWAENKVRREHPELEAGTQEQIDAGESPFYRKVAEEFNDAVNRSQSMADEIHQSTMRKDGSAITKAFTMFKSDSAQGYNQLRQRIGEARYYEKSGADKETVRKAKIAAGEAALGILANNGWAAAISFLIALWKNKGRDYRDEEGELTAGSVFKEVAATLVGNLAGLVTGGEELAEALGAIVTGDRYYGIDVPAFAPIEDLLELLEERGKGAVDLVKGAKDIYQNGGDLEKYLGDNVNGIIGGIKETAMAAAQYFGGLPVANLEAYLMGAVKWASPGLAAAYEDAQKNVVKSDLSGLSGKALEQRVGTILERRLDEVEEATVEALAALYEAGYKGAIPTAAPNSVTIEGEEKELGEAKKQFFDTVWSSNVAGVIDELVQNEQFREADEETREKMLEKLYSYARERAKTAAFAEYEMAKWAKEAANSEDLSEWIVWDVLSAKVSSDFDKLAGAGLDNERALEIALELGELEPEGDAESVSSLQRYGAIFSLPLSEKDLDKAVQAVMSDSAYKKYKTARDAGVDADTYWWFLNYTSGITGDGKKTRVLEFINGLKLSDKQKDALFLAAGYKESGLSSAPWN